jgi:EAL domain-containing protein (putative c-di-GMP-specific phosphodiesterase class I)
MYRAKAQGGARFQVFDTEMHAQAVTMLQMETELRHALERDQLCLCFQPIVSLADGGISWFEALVRWRHPRLGLIRPDEFLPLAEETGIIMDVDRWVLQRSYQQMARWRRSYAPLQVPGVSVNVSNASLAQGDLLSQVCRLRDATGMDPGEIGLAMEITETTIMKRIDLTVGLLSELKPLGIKISVDDFGTGYSSLSYLRRLPIDTLKIDRSFVHDLEQDQENLEIVQTIIDLARSLGLAVVAEGIERRPQYERIRTMRTDYCQGYWFSRPVTIEGAEQMIAESRHWE